MKLTLLSLEEQIMDSKEAGLFLYFLVVLG